MVASLIPPSACPVRLADIREAWRSGKESADSIERFCSVLASRTGKPHAFAFNQARTALTILLQELHRLRSERFEVIVPAYTCYTVAAAVARAGLVMVPVDIEPSDLCFKLQALQDSINERTLAIIVVHPFGQPCDIGAVKGVISNRHIFIVEDCAQAWDTRYRGHFLGGEGDASIFSFGRGKHLNLGGGGICCVGEGEIDDTVEWMAGATWLTLVARLGINGEPASPQCGFLARVVTARFRLGYNTTGGRAYECRLLADASVVSGQTTCHEMV